MKKLLTVFVLLIIAQTSFGQVSQGYKYLSGTVMYSTDRYEDYRTNSVTLMPEFNYMAGDYFSIGLGAGIVHEKYQKDETANSPAEINTTNLYGIAPKLKFFTPIGENVYFSPEVSIPLLFGETEESTTSFANIENTTTYDNSRWGFNAGMGVVFVLGDRISLEAKMGVLSYEVDVKKIGSDEFVEEHFDLGLNFENSGISIAYFF